MGLGAAAAVLALLVSVALPVYAVALSPVLLAGVDINTVIGSPNTVGYITLAGTATAGSFNAEQPGNWGGEYGDGAVTAFTGASHPAGHITFTWTAGFVRHIALRVLDGIADDSFEVYVMNPGGNWALV